MRTKFLEGQLEPGFKQPMINRNPKVRRKANSSPDLILIAIRNQEVGKQQHANRKESKAPIDGEQVNHLSAFDST
jgi:hypothetical protein